MARAGNHSLGLTAAFGILALALVHLGVALFAPTAARVLACSIPVFRWALERTPSAEYELVVVHEGDFTPEEKAVLRRLAAAPEDGANIKVIEAERQATEERLATEVTESTEVERHAKRRGTDFGELSRAAESLPSVTSVSSVAGRGAHAVLRFPAYLGIRAAVWSGPLKSLDPAELLDSPARREIARRILKGEAAVWVLLESGDREADDAAGAVLAAELKKLTGSVELPQMGGMPFDEAEEEGDTVRVSVSFSVLRVPRGGPERLLAEMLLLTEPDLRGYSQPMAFPVFARGRVLFALVGEGINPGNIGDACSFLVGPCACGVQGRMPGVELLMNVDWEDLLSQAVPGLLSGGAIIDQALPPLTGFPGPEEILARYEGEQAGSLEGAGPEREDSIPTTVPSSPQTPGVEDSPPVGTVRNVAVALGAGAVLVALATGVLLRGRKRSRKGGSGGDLRTARPKNEE